MKDYLASISIFCLVIFLLVKLALGQFNKVNTLRQQIEDANFQLQMAQQSANFKSLTLNSRTGNDDPARFLAQYGGTLSQMREPQSITQRISLEAERLVIPIQEQRPGTRTVTGLANDQQLNAHEYTVSITTNFRDALVWLGKVEDAFPFARTESIEISPADNFVSLRATMLFPQVDAAVLTNK